MMTPKEFYKEHYPEEFSDSVVIRVSKLDQDLFAYYLDTLTSNSKETEFEDFCRRIAQNEICPNLIPHTGPTGGGDSKVDSETYPVLSTFPRNGIMVLPPPEKKDGHSLSVQNMIGNQK